MHLGFEVCDVDAGAADHRLDASRGVLTKCSSSVAAGWGAGGAASWRTHSPAARSSGPRRGSREPPTVRRRSRSRVPNVNADDRRTASTAAGVAREDPLRSWGMSSARSMCRITPSPPAADGRGNHAARAVAAATAGSRCPSRAGRVRCAHTVSTSLLQERVQAQRLPLAQDPRPQRGRRRPAKRSDSRTAGRGGRSARPTDPSRARQKVDQPGGGVFGEQRGRRDPQETPAVSRLAHLERRLLL